MWTNQCAAKCCHAHFHSRRDFLSVSALAVGSALLNGCAPRTGSAGKSESLTRLADVPRWGPGAKCVPAIRATFVRRKGSYGMWWPGEVYDGEAARTRYATRIRQTAEALNLKLDLRPEPVYSAAEADEWLAQAKQADCDGLLVVLLDRQEHAWPTADKAVDSGIPAVVFAPVGTAFTTNTAAPSQKRGAVIYSTDDFGQAAYGMKMLAAGARMRATRVVVIRGKDRREDEFPQLGIKLRQVPAATFVDLYKATPENREMQDIADEYMSRAQRVFGASKQDVLNGARSYIVARQIMQREEADGITMDCLGVLGPTKMSLPCLAWSRMNDLGIPAACEADLGAAASHVLVQQLFDRPGFQQDPVPETVRKAIIGAHCSCPTRLNGFDQPAEPFVLRHHHAERDATTGTIWRVGQEVTCVCVVTKGQDKPPKVIISAGRVLENVKVPPSGGCVISVMVKFDGVDDVLAYPGFHQLFFYGNYKQHLVDFCKLFKLEAQVV